MYRCLLFIYAHTGNKTGAHISILVVRMVRLNAVPLKTQSRSVNFWSIEIIAALGCFCFEQHRVIKSKVYQFAFWLKEGHLMFGIQLFLLYDFFQTNSFILLARYKWTLKTTFTGEWVTEGRGTNTQDE